MTNGDGWGKHFSADERCMYWLTAHPFLFKLSLRCEMLLKTANKLQSRKLCFLMRFRGVGERKSVVQNRESPDFRSSAVGISASHKLDLSRVVMDSNP